MTWYVLTVAPSCELRIADRTRELNFGSYCPMMRIVDASHGRARAVGGKLVVERPLFTGYLFVDMRDSSRFDLFKFGEAPPDGVSDCRGFVGGDSGPTPLPGVEIDDLRLRERDGAFDYAASYDAPPKWIKMGRRVELSGGPFAGKFARVLQTAKAGLVKIMVFMFGHDMPIDVPIKWLRPA
jgi:transcription antitermination factor NusG